MKRLILLLLLISGSTWADDGGAAAFVKGFADGFNQARYGGRPYQAPAQAPVTEQAVVTYHYDAVINAANVRGNYYFFSYQECNKFLQRDRTFDECIRVAN